MSFELQRVIKVADWLIFKQVAENRRDLAEKMGYTESSLSQILNAKVKLSERFVKKLANMDMEISEDWLLTGEGEMLKENQTGNHNQPENVYFKGTKPNMGEETLNSNTMDQNLLELMRGQQSQMERMLSQHDEFISIIKNLTSGKGHEVESEKKPRLGSLAAGEGRGELEVTK
jgi:transcriptional regulator with XRE-family HTH domain